MSADLTALLSFKEEDKSISRHRNVSYFALPGVSSFESNSDQLRTLISEEAAPHPNVVAFRNSNGYRIKCSILRVLESIVSDYRFLRVRVSLI